MAKPLREQKTAIRIGAFAQTEPGRVLFENEFFDDPPVVDGSIKVWDGLSWVGKLMKVWSGSAWVQKPVKAWNGLSWVLS